MARRGDIQAAQRGSMRAAKKKQLASTCEAKQQQQQLASACEAKQQQCASKHQSELASITVAVELHSQASITVAVELHSQAAPAITAASGHADRTCGRLFPIQDRPSLILKFVAAAAVQPGRSRQHHG
jgi:hypothetical protein